MSAEISIKGNRFLLSSVLYSIQVEYDDSTDDWPTVYVFVRSHIWKTGIEVSCVFSIQYRNSLHCHAGIDYYLLPIDVSRRADCSIEIKRDGDMAKQINRK